MGAARNALNAAAVAPTGFETWAGIVSNQSDAAGAVSATAEGMDPANSAAVNTAAFNAAIAKAGRNGKVVFDKSGIYQINAGIDLPYAGLTVEGANGIFVQIKQVTANEHGFRLIPDTTYDYSNAIGITIRNLRLSGAGGGTTGVGIWSDPDSVNYQGARLTLDNVHIGEFGLGVRLHRFDGCYIRNLQLKNMPDGWYSTGNANDIHLINCGASTITNVAYRFAGGAGAVFIPSDIINSGKQILVEGTQAVTILGGNFESCTGSEGFIDVQTNAHVTAIGTRFLKGTVETPAFRVATASLIAINCFMAGFTTAPLVQETVANAVVQIMSPSGNLSSAERLRRLSDSVTTLPHSQFIARQDNSVPAAEDKYRGLMLHKVGRDGVSDKDELFFYVKDRSSGADTYSRRTLTNIMSGTGSPEGIVTADVGTLYTRDDGGAGTTLYVKESGTGNTGWVAK